MTELAPHQKALLPLAGVKSAGCSRGSGNKLIRSKRARRRAFQRELNKELKTVRVRMNIVDLDAELPEQVVQECFEIQARLRKKWGV